jgi:hypothetical protein
MNERIDEIAKQSGLHADWYIDNPEIERFAELIIIECMQHLTNIGQDYSCEQLEKYFGVK